MRLLIAILILIALVVGIVALVLRPKPDPFEQLSVSSIEDRGALRVGTRGDVPYMSMKTEDEDGNVSWSGVEIDIARAISKQIFDDDTAVEFIETPFTLRNFMLKQDRVDCLIALSPKGYSEAMIYSDPYYTDAVAIVVMVNGPTTIDALFKGLNGSDTGGRIGALTRQPASSGTVNPVAHQGALTVLQEYNTVNNAGFTIQTFSDAPNMFNALKDGQLDAIAMEARLIPLYIEDDMRLLNNYIGTIPYAVAALPSQESFIGYANIVIQSMKNSGELAQILSSYDISDYAN